MLARPHDGLSLQPDVSKKSHQHQSGLALEVGAARCSDPYRNGKHGKDSNCGADENSVCLNSLKLGREEDVVS